MSTEPRPEWLEKDYYKALEVSENASDEEIKKSYKKLVRKLHPDLNPNNTKAEKRFKEVSSAYDVVGDSETRKKYDEVRRMGAFSGGPGGGFAYGPAGAGSGPGGQGGFSFNFENAEDFFSEIFGSRGGGQGGARNGFNLSRRGTDQQASMNLSFEDAIEGVTREIAIEDKSGRKRKIKVRIPEGVDDGKRIKVSGKGAPGTNGGSAGDLFVLVKVGKNPVFGRQGKDITLTVPIDFSEAAVGADIAIPTYSGKPVTLRIPPGTASGKVFRVKGEGISCQGKTGDMLVTVSLDVPEKLTKKQKEAVQEMQKTLKSSPRKHLEGYIFDSKNGER